MSDVKEQYEYIEKNKQRVLDIHNLFDLDFPNKKKTITELPKVYSLNYKFVSLVRPHPPSIRYKIDYDTDPDEPKNDFIDIYLSTQRNDLINEILGSIINKKVSNLFLHGCAGIGKTHLLLDAVARARVRELEINPLNEKPRVLILHYLINFSNVKFVNRQFSKELLFSCYPLLRYEQNSLKSNKLENLFKQLFIQVDLDGRYNKFWSIVKKIFSYIEEKHSLKFFIVLDQINEIRKKTIKNKDQLQWLDSTFKQLESHVLLKCASNNNQTMREVYLKEIHGRSLDEGVL